MRYDSTFKICILAMENVGKKTLVDKYLGGFLHEENWSLTIGVDFFSITLEIHGEKVKVQTWLSKNEERFKFIWDQYIKGTNGVILMYDITNKDTLNWISESWQILKDNLNYSCPILLVGNKLDLEDNRDIFKDQLERIKESHNVSSSIEISLKTGENVEKMFMKLAEMILGKKIEENEFRLVPREIISPIMVRQYGQFIQSKPMKVSDLKVILLAILSAIIVIFLSVFLSVLVCFQ
ncbi:MAG: Rab family GTPase [Promethearchaeota archaeon]